MGRNKGERKKEKGEKTRTLVIRLSALGDVAMTIPVLYSVANRYPDDEFLFITKKSFHSIFINHPENLKIIPVDTKETKLLSVIAGLTKKEKVDRMADLHNVLRSWITDLYLKMKGAKTAIISKGRKEKRELTRRKNKRFRQLETSVERYQKVFEKLGYDASLDFKSLFAVKNKNGGKNIGIAPFAQHPGKTYPLEQMEEVIRVLNRQPQVQLFLFGGKEEQEKLEEWAGKYENVQSVAGRMSFPEELLLMNNLDVMLSMDSANMHLASLVNTPVISIWGATHPYVGFYGYNQHPDNAIQLDLKCRPCSVFGKKTCMYGTYDCLYQIKPEKIVEKIMNYEL